jgi:hypothetical protein
MQAQTFDWSGGRALMLVLTFLMALSAIVMFRPRQPSPFTQHGAFGAGHGSQSMMFGAEPRAGAPRLR